MARLALLIAGLVGSAVACQPATVAEAERRGDVAWLDQAGTPGAVAALGRLADKSPRAVSALQARTAFDVEAYRAAWLGAVRGAPWATAMVHAGLADPKRADITASAMERRDAHLGMFLGDLEAALVRLSATTQNVNVSAAIASAGALAREPIERRLEDPSTRAAMCRGLASRDSDGDARSILLGAPERARDSPACVDAVVRIAVDDDVALRWLAEQGEPGMLGAAGRDGTFPCARLHEAWTRALASRPREAYAAITVPLSYAVKRCPAEMDGVLADSIVHLPMTRVVVIDSIDPFDHYDGSLHATCAALPLVAGGNDAARLKERATDALYHACKALQ
jgi:hypothetical protein